MSSIQEANKSVARRFVDEVFNSGNAEASNVLVADGARMTVPGAHAYRLDESGKVELERVVFYAVSE